MQIHELDATAILEAQSRGELSAVEVVKALIERRRAVDGKVGAFVHTLDEQAQKSAESVDSARKNPKSEAPLGALAGLPITIKDNISVVGTDATLGISARRGQPAASDAVVVDELRRAGAIFLGKTNIPQLLLVQESDNELFGVTKNPFNLGRTPGGSSGGEAAALASGCSPLGIGTDIGGSIRIPAHFTGICGLKPTVDRWSTRGMNGAVEGQEVVRAQMGPMARSVRDLALVMRALDPARQARRDPAVPPLPIGDPLSVSLKGLRIGYFRDDGYLRPTPAMPRAVDEAAAALKAAGATLVEYTPPASQELIYLWFAVLSSDGGNTLREALRGDRPTLQLRPTFLLARMPGPVRAVMAAVFEGRGEGRLSRLLRSLGEKSVAELWRLTAQRTAMRHAELDAWNAAELDAVICPPHVLPALPLGSSGDLTLTLSYMFRYVMLNFPAGVVPVTRVRAVETNFLGTPRDRVERRCAEVLRGSEGLPVGVQVVARPYREDVALAVMAAIEAEARRQPDYPKTPIDPQDGPAGGKK